MKPVNTADLTPAIKKRRMLAVYKPKFNQFSKAISKCYEAVSPKASVLALPLRNSCMCS